MSGLFLFQCKKNDSLFFFTSPQRVFMCACVCVCLVVGAVCWESRPQAEDGETDAKVATQHTASGPARIAGGPPPRAPAHAPCV